MLTKIENEELIVRFKNFIDSIKENSNVFILHDTDMDGMSSAVLLKKGLEFLGKNNLFFQPFNHSSKRNIDDEFINLLKEQGITHFFALDLSLESFLGVEKLKDFNICVIDHHQIESDYWKHNDNFLLIKPYFINTSVVEGSNVCTANLVYNFFSELTNIEKYDWLCAAGIVGDAGYLQEKEFVDSILIKYGEEIKDDIFKTELGRFVSYVTYADCSDKKNSSNIIFESLDRSADYKSAINYLKDFKPVEDDFFKIINDFENYKEEFMVDGEKIIFYEVKSKYSLKGPVSTYLSFNLPFNLTLITYQIKENEAAISARRQDKKFNMGLLMNLVTENFLEGQGGGHIPAAGASCNKQDIETFKEHIKELHSKVRID
ncbi:DHH family phosphoesterase [Candidatus Woesearchaeota archaeon]|nr:DHH family phosphoesterase [Candidatus Woesearchaeota archaeon]